MFEGWPGERKCSLVNALDGGLVHDKTMERSFLTSFPSQEFIVEVNIKRMIVPGAGFEPAKQYAEELESTPFDHSGTPASWFGLMPSLLDYSSREVSVSSCGRGGGRVPKTMRRIFARW